MWQACATALICCWYADSEAAMLHMDAEAAMQLLGVPAATFASWADEKQAAQLSGLRSVVILAALYWSETSADRPHIAAVRKLSAAANFGL